MEELKMKNNRLAETLIYLLTCITILFIFIMLVALDFPIIPAALFSTAAGVLLLYMRGRKHLSNNTKQKLPKLSSEKEAFYESKGLGFNFGYSIDLVNKIKVGAVIQNLGKMSKLQTDEILLPQRILVGCSKEFEFNHIKNTVYTSVEKNSLIPSAKIHIGNHFNWTRFNLYSGVSSSRDVLESSIGFGLILSRFEIVYGLRFGSQNIGIPQIISIRFLMS